MPTKYDFVMTRPKYGIVIPCFNESGNLERLISECERISKNLNIEFVLVNNGSTDETSTVLAEIHSDKIRVVNLEVNQGYGGGILAGLTLLNTEYVGWIHADLQTDLNTSLSKMTQDNFDFFKGVRLGRSFSERTLSGGMGLVCSVLFRTWLYEINAQPTVMHRDLFHSWGSPPKDFSLDLYALVFAKKQGVTIVRSQFEFLDRVSGKSSWNSGLKSRIKMIKRTLAYAISLFKNGVK